MDPDQDICLCFHVPLRKVKKFIRLEKPRRASQLSECYGAGTGCGWCRPFLERLLADAKREPANTISPDDPSSPNPLDQITPQQFAEQRKTYLQQGKGTPPEPPNGP